MLTEDSQQRFSVLVVEDDENILNLLSAYLQSAGYNVTTATNGDQGLQTALEQSFDICVLDVMLPGKSGIEIALGLRESGCNTPVVFLTARGAEADVLHGFGAGADDYMVKPFSPRILLVRLEAVLKRVQNTAVAESQITTQGAVQLDNSQPVCRVEGKPVELTPHEYRILRKLINEPDRVFERGSLIRSIYGNEDAISPKAIDVHVHHLRSKLGESAGAMIQTVRGFGYKFVRSMPVPR
ncbi:MAG: response regulator transcription factor [Pseudomonadota bacterium]